MNDISRAAVTPTSPGPKFTSTKKQPGEGSSKEEKLDWRIVYGELNDAMAALNSSIDRRIAANDADFMEAYRVSYEII